MPLLHPDMCWGKRTAGISHKEKPSGLLREHPSSVSLSLLRPSCCTCFVDSKPGGIPSFSCGFLENTKHRRGQHSFQLCSFALSFPPCLVCCVQSNKIKHSQQICGYRLKGGPVFNMGPPRQQVRHQSWKRSLQRVAWSSIYGV